MNKTRITTSFALLSSALLLLPDSGFAQTIEQRNLPDALTLLSGQQITTSTQWRTQRREELLELFRTHVYGRAPLNRPDSLSFQVLNTNPQAMGGTATLKEVAIDFSGPGGSGRINLVLFVPNSRAGRAPAMLLICNRNKSNIDPTRQTKTEFWPAEEIIARGYAAAAFHVSDADDDSNDGFNDGVHAIFGPNPRAADSWATLAAWSWGARRVMDYLETDPDIHAGRVAVVGHSRGGKAALWAGAQDERFAMVVSNNSGSTGAALARGKEGERIANLNSSFPHWCNDNYKLYNNNEQALPIDQHELIGLIAPRAAYIASASGDSWADPESEFLSGVAANPVYQLFSLTGMPQSTLPSAGVTLHTGHIGYHMRSGGHDMMKYDWSRFIDFANLRMTGNWNPVFEVEHLTMAAKSTDNHRLLADSRYSEGRATILDSNAVGDFVTYTVPNLEARRYDMYVGVKKYPTRGTFQLAIAPSTTGSYNNHCAPVDLYSPNYYDFVEIPVGTIQLGTPGNKAFRFTVSGKNASSTDHTLCFDYIRLIAK